MCVGEGGGEADRCFLQPAPRQRPPTAGTLSRDRQTEDLLLAVSQPDQGRVHVHRWPQTPLSALLYHSSPYLLCSSSSSLR